jgi:hypothetical protein
MNRMNENSRAQRLIDLDPPATPKSVIILRVLVISLICGAYVFWRWFPAQPDKVDREARSYLAACPARPDAAACEAAAAGFAALYRAALSGNAPAQAALVSRFMDGDQWVARNMLQGCAWSLVVAHRLLGPFGADEYARIQQVCARSSDLDWLLVTARAEQLRAALQGSR